MWQCLHHRASPAPLRFTIFPCLRRVGSTSISPVIRSYHDAERLAMPLFIFHPNQLVKLSLGEVGSADAIDKELAAICFQLHLVTSQTGNVVEVGAMVRQDGMCHGLTRGTGLGTKK